MESNNRTEDSELDNCTICTNISCIDCPFNNGITL